MSLGRTLLPIAGPLVIALALAVVTSLGDEQPAAPEERAPAYPEHAPRPAPPEAAPGPPPQARPAGPPVDRPRCLASMTVEELGRQLMTLRQVELVAELYREEAPPEVARAYLQGLADAATALAPGVARSRLLVLAADGLVQLGHAAPARAALEASRELPAPAANEFGFERSDWRGHAARVAARLDDHALAQTLVEQDAAARAELARHYAETGDDARAKALLDREPPSPEGASWRRDTAAALAGIGELDAALALDRGPDPLLRLVVARTLKARGRRDDAIEVLRVAEGLREDEWWDRLGTATAIARELGELDRRDEALALVDRVREELRARGDHFRALEPWATAIDVEHRLGRTAQAFEDLEAFAKLPLADMNAAPMVRTLMLTREGRLAEALAVISATAAITYPLAYAHVHARMRQPDPAVEAELDHGLRYFCTEP